MKLVSSISSERALRNISAGKAPPGIPQLVWDRGHDKPSQALGWYRGRHAGLYDAYLTIRQDHPRIAEKFRKAVGFDKDGAFRSGSSESGSSE